eukprot:gnl/Hemi2/24880_TR8366_c0_g1_i1.p1 gnl/Hemi2/24880_TR8366_c0_g1~~gnl/Hemi2/24880_TR8366_c0_g1_i1.p1  ORF type:complete len:394 (-),score=68.50 gnl/Hemi2/24880_TR8366_c0_g1_i1:180-1361(-)
MALRFVSRSVLKNAWHKSGGGGWSGAGWKRRAYLCGAACVALCGASLGVISAAEQSNQMEQSWWDSFKSSKVTNYQNRIRDLSSPEKVFNYFARVRKGNKLYMTLDDFTRAIIPHHYDAANPHKDRHKNKPLPACFQTADSDGDGLISFEEYLFFITLLSIPLPSLTVAFQMMDTDGNGTLDQSEFLKVMSFVQSQSSVAKKTRSKHAGGAASSFLAHFFGADGKGSMTFNAFSTFLNQLHSDVRRLEFDLYDSAGLGQISPRSFAELMVNYTTVDRDSYRARAKLLPDDAAASQGISFQQYETFSRLFSRLDDVETCMKLYTTAGHPFTRSDFGRLAAIISNSELSPKVVDIIFHVFDKNGDGSLEASEFVQSKTVRPMACPARKISALSAG